MTEASAERTQRAAGEVDENVVPGGGAPHEATPPGATSESGSSGEASRLRWLSEPNPVWLREMRQSARLTRTPLILCLLTVFTALIIATVGGVGASNADPATVGSILFHTFFSLAFVIVSVVGPGVAAMTIASERSGRTWESVLLTRMTARRVARGKFAAAFTYIAMYVVMLAPVGAMSFLFGGVSAIDVTLAFAWLFVFCVLAVGFGLSISSAIGSPTVAMLVTVPVATLLAIAVYVGLGIALSVMAHRFWPAVTEGAPVWLPTAYGRAEFGWVYLLTLVFAPLAAAFVLATFFYEVTAANIAQESDDRSSGLRRWFLRTTPLLLLLFCIPRALETDRDDMWQTIIFAMAAMQVFFGAVLFMFAGEPLTPSARVRYQWRAAGASRWRRFLGPGVEPATLLLLFVGGLTLTVLVAAGAFQEFQNAKVSGTLDVARLSSVLSFGGYALCFLLFLSGFVLFVRARSAGRAAPRVLLLLVVFFANAGPWLLLAMGGLMGRLDEILWLAAPAPSFTFELMDALLANRPNARTLLVAMIAAAAAWALVGVVFWGLGSRNLRRRVTELRRERERPAPSAP